jgi:hypothetical protein
MEANERGKIGPDLCQCMYQEFSRWAEVKPLEHSAQGLFRTGLPDVGRSCAPCPVPSNAAVLFRKLGLGLQRYNRGEDILKCP